MICPYCGTENRNMAKFCDSCGSELPTVAPEAREMFADDILIEGSDAVTLDLQGLEKMVDSSNSGIMYDSFDGTSAYADAYGEPYAGGSLPTVPLSPGGQGVPVGAQVGPTRAIATDAYDDAYATTIPLGGAAPYQTAEFGAVGAPDHDGSSAVYGGEAAKTFASGASGSSSGKRRKAVVGIVLGAIVLLAALAAFVTYNLQLWGGIAVPDVVRQTEVMATATLEGAGFTVDVDHVVSDDVAGIVVSTNPGAGSRAEEGSLVTISVSIPRVIPEIIGLPQEEALAALEEAGYEDVEVMAEKSNEPEGSVIAVLPEVGVEATSDEHIAVTVAEPFRVPSVEGLTRDEAISALEAEGYAVRTVSYITEDIPEGMAVSTDPAAGSALASGSEVVLNVAHNRSTELIEATKAYFAGSNRFTIGGINYELSEVRSVTYQGSDSVAYTITARPYETHTWLFGDTETRYGNYETISGTITYAADNSIKAADPSISRVG